MATKHTSGPWEIVDHSHYPSIKVLRGPSFHVSVVMAATDLTFEDYLQRSADLELMSAAPYLLEALEACTRWMEMLRDSGDAGFWDWGKDSEYTAAIAVIRKAKGEQT